MLRRLLAGAPIKPGQLTIPDSVPPADTDQRAAIAETKNLLRRLADGSTTLHPSPLFDRLTPEQWQTLHLMHAAHHLSFLQPEDTTPD